MAPRQRELSLPLSRELSTWQKAREDDYVAGRRLITWRTRQLVSATPAGPLSLSLSPSTSFFFFFVCFCFFFFFFCYRPFLPQRWLLRLLCVNPQHKRDQFILTFAEPPPPPLVPSSSVQNPNLHYHLNLPVKSIHPLIPLIVVSAA